MITPTATHAYPFRLITPNRVPGIYVCDENDWTTRASWAWWHWLDETWLGWHRWGWDIETGIRICDDPEWYYAGYYADSEVRG